MNLAEAFAEIAAGVSAAFGGPYYDAVAHTTGAAIKDAGGSIVAPGQSIARPCQVQVDAVTDAMRADAGYVQGDVRLLVLRATLDGSLAPQTLVEVTGGPDAGAYSVESVGRDPLGLAWDCRGRVRG